MIRNFLLIGVLLLINCSSENSNSRQQPYLLTDDTVIDLAAPDKLVLINYWAIWCAPCRKEVPELNELMHLHQDKLHVVGVNFDGAKDEKLRSEVTKLGIEFPNFTRDPRQLWGLEPVTVLPETLILDGQGNLLHRLVGPQHRIELEALMGLQNPTDSI